MGPFDYGQASQATEPVDVGDHQGVARGHQVQQFQEAAAVVLGPAGLLGADVAHGAAGADQPFHLQVQVLVLGLPDRDPGISIQRHPRHPWLEYLKYGFLPDILQLGFPAAPSATGRDNFQPVAVNRAVSSHAGQGELPELTFRTDRVWRWTEQPCR